VDLFSAQPLRFTDTDQDSTELIRPLTISLDSAIRSLRVKLLARRAAY